MTLGGISASFQTPTNDLQNLAYPEGRPISTRESEEKAIEAGKSPLGSVLETA
jgi:hypothetical protein